MSMRLFKRTIATTLTIALLLTAIPFTVFSEAPSATIEANDEYIYYSDLFYTYSYYLNDLEFLSNHLEAQTAMSNAFNQYLDSPQFTWAAISKDISLITNMSTLMLAYSDKLGITNASYHETMDKANRLFMQELFSLKVSDIESISRDTKCVGQFKNVLSTLQKVLKALYAAKDIETYDDFVDLSCADLEEYCEHLKPLFPSLKSGTYTALSELLSFADSAQEVMDIFTAFIISLAMEDIRLELIQDIINTQPSGSILHEGMTRLYNQLEDGFVEYFIDTYLEGKLLETISQKTAKHITSSVMKEIADNVNVSSTAALTSLYGAVTASIGFINTAIFDWILGDYIPSIEDYQIAMILTQYSNLMRDSIKAKRSVFQKQFETGEIETYETFMCAYAASMRCALDNCLKLVAPINNDTAEKLIALKRLYSDNFYVDYLNKVIQTIYDTPVADRVITDFGEWRISKDTTLRGPSDTIQENSLYCSIDGFSTPIYNYSDITLTIPEGEVFTVCGNLRLSVPGYNYTPTELINYGTLNVTGNFTFGGNVYNYGEMNVSGDVTGGGGSGGRTRFYMTKSSAVLRVGGDLYFYHEYDVGAFSVVKSIDFVASKLTGGTLILNGKGKQTVDGLSAAKVILENTSASGVEFATTIAVSSLFDHKGNHFSLTNQRLVSTFADYDGDGLKDNVDPHPTVGENCLEGHTYGDWKIVRKATPKVKGLKYKVCTGCNSRITEQIPLVEALAFKGAALMLQHNLSLHYKVDRALFEEVGYTNPYVVFELGGVKTTVKNYTAEGDRYIFRFRNIAPNQINDTIYATLYATYNGVEYASETKAYSVAEYCYSTLKKYSADTYAELRTLLVNLLHYGTQSQLYTNHNTANLANAALTQEQLAWGTTSDPVLTNALNTTFATVENPLITWKGANLNLNQSISMQFKFLAQDIEGLHLEIVSETGHWKIAANKFVLQDGVYVATFSELNAGQMKEKVYLTMYKDGSAVSNTVCYSIESYAYSKKDSTIAHLSDLVKTMMNYGNAAYLYIN